MQCSEVLDRTRKFKFPKNNNTEKMAVLKNRMKFKIFAVRICTYKEHKMTPFTPQIRKRPVWTLCAVCVLLEKIVKLNF